MSSNTSLVAQQVRLQQWATLIRECQNRPFDMDVSTWCEQHGITKANYYYRLRRVREAVLQNAVSKETSFVEIPVEPQKPSGSSNHSETAAVMHSPNGLTVEFCNTASSEFLRNLMEAFNYA